MVVWHCRLEKKNEQSTSELWDTFKQLNMWLIGIPEGKERKEGKRKTIWRNNGQKVSNVDENHIPKKHEATPRRIINQVA